VEGTDAFWVYIRELRRAQRFALLNREEMMDRVASAAAPWAGIDRVEPREQINCHHD
jgi:tRNA-splicing ligase RtcB